jgi:type I restriction enzyme M protein
VAQNERPEECIRAYKRNESMTANTFHHASQIESSLGEAADQLRANSKLTSSECCKPVLDVIFLRHVTNHYSTACKPFRPAKPPANVKLMSITPAQAVEAEKEP